MVSVDTQSCDDKQPPHKKCQKTVGKVLEYQPLVNMLAQDLVFYLACIYYNAMLLENLCNILVRLIKKSSASGDIEDKAFV